MRLGGKKKAYDEHSFKSKPFLFIKLSLFILDHLALLTLAKQNQTDVSSTSKRLSKWDKGSQELTLLLSPVSIFLLFFAPPPSSKPSSPPWPPDIESPASISAVG
jgi:hypothetical protein